MARYWGIDLEWASASPTSICEIGMGDDWVPFSRLVRPEPLRFGIHEQRVHRITPDMVRSADPFAVVWHKAQRRLTNYGVTTLVAHNASAEARRLTASIAATRRSSISLDIHCTLRWVRALRQGRHTQWERALRGASSDALGVLATHLGLGDAPHRALADAQVSRRLAEWVMQLTGAADPAQVDAILGTEPYRVHGEVGWANVQLLDVCVLTAGQLYLAAGDHRRAKNRDAKKQSATSPRATDEHLAPWLVEDSWGSLPAPQDMTLAKVCAAPKAHGLREHRIGPTHQTRTSAALRTDQAFLGVVSATTDARLIHDLLVGDVLLALKALGAQARGEARLAEAGGPRPDLLVRFPGSYSDAPWWPVEIDRNPPHAKKRLTRAATYFDRTRVDVAHLDATGIADPLPSVSWVGLATLVRHEATADLSRVPLAFVTAAEQAPEWDLIEVVHAYQEDGLWDMRPEERRQRILAIRASGRFDVNLPSRLQPRPGPRLRDSGLVESVDQALRRRAEVLPLPRDLAAVGRAVRAIEDSDNEALHREIPLDLGHAVDTAFELDPRIFTGKRDPGERGRKGGPHTGGKIRSDHATILITGTIGDALETCNDCAGKRWFHHRLELRVPDWMGDRADARRLEVGVAMPDVAHRRPGQRVWGRGVIVAANGTLDDTIFGTDAYGGPLGDDDVLIVIGWSGPIPATE